MSLFQRDLNYILNFWVQKTLQIQLLSNQINKTLYYKSKIQSSLEFRQFSQIKIQHLSPSFPSITTFPPPYISQQPTITQMSTRKWFQLSQSLIQVYPQSQIAYKYKKLPLEYFHIALAPFSGPIAILYNRFLGQQVQIKLTEPDDTSILIFSPKGELKKVIPFEMKDRVILFRFTENEELLVVYASGEYVMVDPFSGGRSEGTFFVGEDQVSKGNNQRCIGAVIDGEQCVIVREKQFGLVKSFKNYWTPLPNLRPNIENPIFTTENLPTQKKRLTNLSPTISSLIYLSKQNSIQEYTPPTNTKRIIFQSQYLKSNSKNLICISKRQTTLVLIFRTPFKILYITLSPPNSSTKATPADIVTHDPMIELKQRMQINKKKSKHNYMSLNHQIIWLGSSLIAAYNNGKMLVIFDHTNIKAIYNQHTESKMIHSVVQEIDGFRVIGEEHTLYREVNLIYQELVSLESLQEAQYRIFAHNEEIEREKQQLRERLLYNKVEESELTSKEKGLVIHELHEIYQKYINKQMIPIADLNGLKAFAGPMLKEIVDNGVKCLDKLQLIKIMKFATFVQNYFTFSGVAKKERQSDIRLSEFKQMESEDNLLGLMGGGNLYSFLSAPIQELCSELRILNALKYSNMKRFLTIEEFHFLKYEKKDQFIDLLLRYNMHYELDLMFGDSQAKAKIFYHWAKCKIQKDSPNQLNLPNQQPNQSSLQSGNTSQASSQQAQSNPMNESTDNLIFQTIIEKYDSLKDKFYPNNNLFSELAKYCVDRKKLNLGLKLLEHEQQPEKKALVGLLILVAKKDKHLVEKVLEFTERSKRSPIVYRVIKQLLHLNWIEKHLWTNLFHNRLIVEEHFIKYNEFIYMWDNVKDYFLQNKMLVDLGYMGIRQTIWNEAKEIVKKEEIERENIGTRCLFNEKENEQIRQRIVTQYQSLVPNISLALKKHTSKPKSGLSILKRLKFQPNPIIQDDVDTSLPGLNDKQLQYLGQIILQKDDNKQLATYVFTKIRSDKCYRILMKQGRYKEAVDLAAERRNLGVLRELVEVVEGVVGDGVLVGYARDRVKEVEIRGAGK